MSENIQFQKVVVDGVIIKVGRDNIRLHIVGRMLHRREGMDLLAQGQNDDSAGVLARGTAHTYAALGQTADLAVSLLLAFVLKIMLHITESRLLGHRCNRPRPESLAFTENNLRIAVGVSLIVSREVQVDIRLLISFKSQEGFKGDIKAGLS